MAALENSSLSDSTQASFEAASLLDSCANLIQARDFEGLKAIAYAPDGFRDDTVRRIVWPFLLSANAALDKGKGKAKEVLHRDESQVALDVHRSFIHLLEG